MKKFILIVALIFVFVVSAFSLKVFMVTDVGGLGDKSFNDGTWAGIQQAAEYLGLETAFVQSKEQADYIPNLSNAAKEGDIVFAVGFMMTDAIVEVATQFTDTYFIGIDIFLPEVVENVSTYLFKEQEGAFLVGYLAAAVTEENKLGFIGGIPIPPVERFRYGYEAGIKTYEELNGETIELIKGYTNDFNDPKKGKDLAVAQFAEGADIVFHASGTCGNGVIEAAQEKGAPYYAIGVDVDQDYMAPGRVLTSSMKRIDVAAYDAVLSVALGTFEPGNHTLGIVENGVGISPMNYTKDDVNPAVLAEIEILKELVINGTIVIPDTQEALDAFVVPDIEL